MLQNQRVFGQFAGLRQKAKLARTPEQPQTKPQKAQQQAHNHNGLNITAPGKGNRRRFRGKPACRGSQGHSLEFCPVRGKQAAQGIGSVVVWIFFCHIFDYLIECLALGLPPQAPPGGIMPPAPRNVLYLFLGQQTGVVPQPRNVMRIAAASLNNLL